MSKLVLAGQSVGRIGLGVMNMTWGQSVPYEEAFAAIRTAVDNGANVINSANFYGPTEQPDASLRLLNAFYEANPTYIDKTVLCVKGAINFAQHKVSGEINSLREDFSKIKASLGDKKKVDVLVVTRIPQDVPIEETMANLKLLQSEGHFKAVGLSEVNASTLRRAHAVHPVSAVENELSLFFLEQPVLDVVDVCKELGIIFTAYSPLGRGMLVKRYKSLDELPPDDLRRRFPRFQGENFAKNLVLADKIAEIASAKGITAGQLALAYILHLAPEVVALQGSTNPDRIIENIGAAKVELTSEDIKAIDTVLESFDIAGDRYHAAAASALMQ